MPKQSVVYIVPGANAEAHATAAEAHDTVLQQFARKSTGSGSGSGSTKPRQLKRSKSSKTQLGRSLSEIIRERQQADYVQATAKEKAAAAAVRVKRFLSTGALPDAQVGSPRSSSGSGSGSPANRARPRQGGGAGKPPAHASAKQKQPRHKPPAQAWGQNTDDILVGAGVATTGLRELERSHELVEATYAKLADLLPDAVNREATTTALEIDAQVFQEELQHGVPAQKLLERMHKQQVNDNNAALQEIGSIRSKHRRTQHALATSRSAPSVSATASMTSGDLGEAMVALRRFELSSKVDDARSLLASVHGDSDRALMNLLEEDAKRIVADERQRSYDAHRRRVEAIAAWGRKPDALDDGKLATEDEKALSGYKEAEEAAAKAKQEAAAARAARSNRANKSKPGRKQSAKDKGKAKTKATTTATAMAMPRTAAQSRPSTSDKPETESAAEEKTVAFAASSSPAKAPKPVLGVGRRRSKGMAQAPAALRLRSYGSPGAARDAGFAQGQGQDAQQQQQQQQPQERRVMPWRKKWRGTYVAAGTRPWWEEVASVDDILMHGDDANTQAMNYGDLMIQCNTIRKSAPDALEKLNKSHNKWIESQIEWEAHRHEPLYRALEVHARLAPKKATKVVIGNSTVEYCDLFL